MIFHADTVEIRGPG